MSSSKLIRAAALFLAAAAFIAHFGNPLSAIAARHGNSHGTNVRQVKSTLLVDIVTDDGQARTVEVTGLFLAVDYSAYYLDLAGRLQVAKWPYVGHSSTAVSETGYEYTISWHTQGLDKTQ